MPVSFSIFIKFKKRGAFIFAKKKIYKNTSFTSFFQKIAHSIKFVPVITCLGGQFGIIHTSVVLKILKLPERSEGDFKIFKNARG